MHAGVGPQLTRLSAGSLVLTRQLVRDLRGSLSEPARADG